MTTVIYHNGILATDSRVSYSDTDHQCVKCNSTTVKAKDDRNKLQVPKGKKFQGENIVAMAGSGNSDEIDRVVAFIQKGGDIVTVYESARSLMGTAKQVPDYTFMIVTDVQIHILDPGQEEYDIETKKLTESTGIGSGSKAALMALMLTNMTPMEAVQAASLIDRYTGGEIQWVDCAKPEIGVQRVVPESDEVFLAKHRPAPIQDLLCDVAMKNVDQALSPEAAVISVKRLSKKKTAKVLSKIPKQ